MPEPLALSLQETVDREYNLLKTVADSDAGVKPPPGKWSQKEELGHLVDSAANNHMRFVRASLDTAFRGPGYQQDAWVSLHGYQEMVWADLLNFWRSYNLFLVGLVRRIPEEFLKRECVIGESRAVTLGFVIEDYILHMQHHLDHILKRNTIRQYPGATAGV